MRIEISGHHLTVTDSIRQAIHQKLEKIESHHPKISACEVILTVERNCQIAEINTQYLGYSISVEARNSDLYTAIAEATSKLNTKLAHKKSSQKSKRYQKTDIGDQATTAAP